MKMTFYVLIWGQRAPNTPRTRISFHKIGSLLKISLLLVLHSTSQSIESFPWMNSICKWGYIVLSDEIFRIISRNFIIAIIHLFIFHSWETIVVLRALPPPLHPVSRCILFDHPFGKKTRDQILNLHFLFIFVSPYQIYILFARHNKEFLHFGAVHCIGQKRRYP